MRNLLALLGAAVVTFVVVGWFLGWYQVKTNPGPDGHREVHVDLNGDKIKTDLDKGRTRLFGLIDGAQQPKGGQTVTPTPPANGQQPAAVQSGDSGGSVVVRPAGGGLAPETKGDVWTLPKR